MKLFEVFLEAIEDIDTSPMPGMDNGQVLSLPNTKFVISVFNDEKKLLFTPQGHSDLPLAIIDFVYDLRDLFNVLRVNDKEEGIFEVEFDPRQDFNEVLTYVKEEMGVDDGL